MWEMVRIIWAMMLAVLLAACSTVGQLPGKDLVEQAIAMQLHQAQQALSQQLRLDDQLAEIKINRVAIAAQTPLKINNLSSFHITGSCDYTIQRSNRAISQRDIPFETYLQRQSEGKTWRVAVLKNTADGEVAWVTQRIPTAVYK
jgi:hypothetical protein